MREGESRVIESRLAFVCGAAQERRRHGSPFGPRWPRARNRPSEGDWIGQKRTEAGNGE